VVADESELPRTRQADIAVLYPPFPLPFPLHPISEFSPLQALLRNESSRPLPTAVCPRAIYATVGHTRMYMSCYRWLNGLD